MFEMKISKEELQEIILEELRKEMLEEGELEEGIGRKLRNFFGMQSEKDFEDEAEDIAVDEAAGIEEDLTAAQDALMDAKNALLKLVQLDPEAVGVKDIKSIGRVYAEEVDDMWGQIRSIIRGRKPGMKPTEAGEQAALDKARRTRGRTFTGNPGEATAGMVRGRVDENKKRKKRR